MKQLCECIFLTRNQHFWVGLERNFTSCHKDSKKMPPSLPNLLIGNYKIKMGNVTTLRNLLPNPFLLPKQQPCPQTLFYSS